MAENAGGLHFDGCHLSDGLNVEAVIGELVTDFVVVSDDHDLDNDLRDEIYNQNANIGRILTHIRFLLRAEASVERI